MSSVWLVGRSGHEDSSVCGVFATESEAKVYERWLRKQLALAKADPHDNHVWVRPWELGMSLGGWHVTLAPDLTDAVWPWWVLDPLETRVMEPRFFPTAEPQPAEAGRYNPDPNYPVSYWGRGRTKRDAVDAVREFIAAHPTGEEP